VRRPLVGRRRGEIAGAFVDRLPIDWAALSARTTDPADRATLDSLGQLDRLRAGTRRAVQGPKPSRAWSIVLQAMVAIGAVQAIAGLQQLATAGVTGSLTPDLAPPAVLALAFIAASVMLGTAIPRDERVFFLLASFTLIASAFARRLIAASPEGVIAVSLMVHGICPEAFAPAALWQFAAAFPSVRRFTTFDRWARRMANVAGALGVGLFATNVLLAHGVLPERFAMFSRDRADGLFWQLFAAAALSALAVIVMRSTRAPRGERIKVVRFGWAVGLGGMPLLLMGLAETLPGIDAWIVQASLYAWADWVVLASSLAMPILATVAVLVDSPFGAPAMGAGAPRRGIARVMARLDAIRARLLRSRHHRDRMSLALDRVRLARGSREIARVIQEELRVGIGAESVMVVHAEALPANTALLPILQHSSAPIDFARSTEPFILLPAHDRQWLEAARVTHAAAVRLRDGTIPAVALLTHADGADSFNRAERWFMSTLLTAASAAWDAPRAAAVDDDCADECVSCGLVRVPGGAPCCAGAATRLAALPARLADRFEVVRRLGSGGMGIVYLGRDRSLGREVALKTWSGVGEAMATRLRTEARVMATLSHHAIATIYGLEWWRLTPVLVMEYCAEGTLATRISRAPLPIGDVLRLGIRLADALTYMHGRGVLHRDIKPSNIGFTTGGIAKLLDFGLAGSDDQPGGTPAYLPPEARHGAGRSPTVDLWGLAAVLREAVGEEATWRAPLDAFFRRALAAAPADRFQSTQEMRAALSRVLADLLHQT
jgi:hypothetical protein